MLDRTAFLLQGHRSRLCALILTAILLGSAPAFAAASLSITPLTWNIIGLDSNNVNVGPNHFPVGARVCNTGDAPATNVTSVFVWDSANSYIDLRPGTLPNYNAAPVPSLAPAACHDFYYEVEVDRDPAAYDTTRRYHITATADTLGTVSTPIPRELYVEHLVSQARNHVTEVKLNGQTIANGGTMVLVVGNTYTISLVGSTATNGYEQIESFINFPNTIFQVQSVATTYSADTSPYVNGAGDDKLYGDACKWENDPNSPYYRSCRDVGKAGGQVVVNYTVKILQVPSAPLVNPQPLSTLIFDFSGSSYHYNDDFGTSTRFADVITGLPITKSFNPGTTNVNGVSTLTFTIPNTHDMAISGLSFSDVFPTTPSAMVVANPPNASTSGCGAPTFAPAAGAGSISFSGGMVAANSSCTVQVNVTVPAAGTYNNTSNHLFIDGVDTGNFASASLNVNNAPPPPAPVCGLTLAQWTFPAGFLVTSPAPSTDNVPGVPSGTPGDGVSPASFTDGANSWGSDGDITLGATLVAANEEYFEFNVDTTGYTGLQVSFDAARKNTPKSPQGIAVYRGTSSLPKDSTEGNGAAADPGVSVFSSSTALPLSTPNFSSFGPFSLADGTTHVRIYFFNSDGVNSGFDAYLDNVTFTGCVVPSPPTLSKSFSPDTVAVGATSTLTFTITNPSGIAASGIGFEDTLPVGVTFTGAGSTTCGGTPTFNPPNKVSLAGGSLGASASCTVTATVTVTAGGPHVNVSGAVSSTQGGTNTGLTGFGTDTITGILPPDIAKEFSPNPVLAGTPTTLTFTLTNPNPSPSPTLMQVAFSDTFPVAPGAMVVAPAPNVTMTGCGAPTFAPSPGSGSISFSGGTIAAGTPCIVKVDVVAPVGGNYPNTTGPVSHIVNGVPANGGTASATLVVNPATPGIALLKQVGPTASGPWSSFLAVPVGGNVFYRFTVENVGNVPLNSVNVSDPLVSTASCTWPSPLPVASPTDDPTAICVVGPVLAVSGNNPNTATASGTNGTTVTDISTAVYATTALTIAKSVAQTTFSAAGDVLNYSFLVTNTGFAALAGPVTVADDKATDESCPAVSTVGDLDNFLDPGESITCTATYTVTASDVTAGFVTNTASATADGVTSNTDYRTVPIVGGTLAPSIAKSFSPNPIAVGGVSTLTFTINNPNAGTDLTGVAFTDTFPAGMQVAATPNATTTNCGSPTFAPAAGNTSVSFSGGTVLANGTCTVTVSVTATTAGSKANTTSNVTSTNGGTGNTGTGILTVIAPPSLAKSFSPNPIGIGGVSTLTFTINNPNGGTALTGVAFTDAFPAGLQVAATPNAGTSGCGSPTFAPAAGNTSVSFSGGTIAASGTCTVTVDVTATTAGAKANTTGNVTSTNGGTGNTGSDTLTVLSPPSLAKAFSPNPIAVGGVSTLTFTITNPNSGTALNGVSFTDTFPAGLQVAATPNASTSGCGSPTFAPVAGNTSVSFSGGTIAANGVCTVSVSVTATTAGAKVNTTGNVTSTNGGTGNTGNSTLNVIAPPSIAKAFSPNPILTGGVSTLTFTVSNPNSGTALTGVAFTDTFPAGLEVAATPNASTAGCGSPAFAPAAGNTSVSFSGGTIAASGTCIVTVNVTATTSGAKVNTTGNVTSTNGGTGNTGTSTLTVNQTAPIVAALKTSSFVAANNDLDGSGSLSPGDTLLYTIVVTNTGNADALAVILTDTPGAHTTLVAGSVTTTQGTVTNGNQAGATSVMVDLGTLPATTGQATVTFTVKLDKPFPPGVTTIQNQGLVTGSNFPDVPTNDPRTPPSGDPTVDVVAIVVEIPTLSEWGALILMLLLAAAAARRLRTVRSS